MNPQSPQPDGIQPTPPPDPTPASAVPSQPAATPVAAPVAPQNPSPTPAAPVTEPLVYPQPDPEHTATPPDSSKNQRSWWKSISLGVLNWLLIPGLIVLFLHLFVFQAFHVIGTSMVPTLHDTDYLIISKIGATESQIARLFKKDSPYIPKRDQIIVFHYPQDPSLVFIKRTIGLPGERVVVHDGKVTVYNKEHPEGFNPDTGTDRTGYPTLGEIDETVPAGNVFVLGDNRSPDGSFDSREWGMLPYHYIIGDTVLRLIPANQITIF